MTFQAKEQVLLSKLKEQCSPSLYRYAERELTDFYTNCYKTFDERAVHTDREGQPRLIRYDRFGEEVSHVWVNEGYKQTVDATYKTGIVGYIHKDIPELGEKGNYTYSFAQGYILSQVEPGFYCPVTLTMAVAYVVDHFASDALKERFLPHLLATGDVELYEGATFLTERQGGSDVGANVVCAVPDENHYRLYGEKYFASNVGQCGVAAVLARIEGAESGTKGLSLFLVPWKEDDGKVNQLYVRRLKDKLGVRAVPSGEVVFDGAKAYLVGDETRGLAYMMEALNLSRICNSIASVGIMKRALNEAVTYAEKREAFGKKLTEHTMIQETIATLYARQEIQLSALFESIALYEQVASEPEKARSDDIALNRLFIALLKARTAKEAITFSHEAIELHGGNGYIEDFVLPRLLRDAQVLTVWEGTENILALEVLRLLHTYQVDQLFSRALQEALSRAKQAMAPVVLAQVEKKHASLTVFLAKLKKASREEQMYHAKRLADQMTDLWLVVHGYARSVDKRSRLLADILRRHLWMADEYDDTMLESFAVVMARREGAQAL
ncbi:acyl-CoA dehydrogenase family protein [Shouchella lonarensis]|uniref:Acyl-CoA dehydrogenase n=1 Tax=Shouchella lonarensis TaxID=1464122 RepID=A0A1G6MZ65_9BACI|nr:acyl-CoA dehydrogenase family protein [Shouchella lonarensis]SDC60833.1 Acyl-CoA dehydrogenase [Shouchella lonarensis]